MGDSWAIQGKFTDCPWMTMVEPKSIHAFCLYNFNTSGFDLLFLEMHRLVIITAFFFSDIITPTCLKELSSRVIDRISRAHEHHIASLYKVHVDAAFKTLRATNCIQRPC